MTLIEKRKACFPKVTLMYLWPKEGNDVVLGVSAEEEDDDGSKEANFGGPPHVVNGAEKVVDSVI